MSGFGFGKTYEVSGENCEWEDILIEKKVKTQESVWIEKGLDPEEMMARKMEKEKRDEPEPEITVDPMSHANLDELDELEDDYDDDKMLQKYRLERIKEMKIEQARNRFGDVVLIDKKDWVREVTDASKTGATVVVHLHAESMIESRLLHEHLITLATKFKYIKFCRIKGSDAVPNWPDANCPTLFVYQDGELKHDLLKVSSLCSCHDTMQ